MVRLERHGDLAVIEIDHPPVNVLSNAMRGEILAPRCGSSSQRPATTRRRPVRKRRENLHRRRADLRGFRQAARQRSPPPDICAALDAAPKPVVAALHRYRARRRLRDRAGLPRPPPRRPTVASRRRRPTKPRVGLIPGAGGTQRLTRMVGAMAAFDMVTTGRHVPAEEALKLGLVEEIATDLRKQAIHRARALADAGTWPRVRDRAVPAVRSRRVRRRRRPQCAGGRAARWRRRKRPRRSGWSASTCRSTKARN